MSCSPCEWQKWGTRVTKYGRVPRVRCRSCGRVRDKDPDRPEVNLRRGQQAVDATGTTRWMDFWSRVGRRFGWIGLPEALKEAAKEVGVSPSTQWRWAQRLDFRTTPKPPWVRQSAWRLLEICLGQYRRGRATRRRDGDVTKWADSVIPEMVRGGDFDLLRTIAEARLVAAVLAGERIPGWVDRLLDFMGSHRFRADVRASAWREYREHLGAAPLELASGRDADNLSDLMSEWRTGDLANAFVADVLLDHAERVYDMLSDEDPEDWWLEVDRVFSILGLIEPVARERAQKRLWKWLWRVQDATGTSGLTFRDWFNRSVLDPSVRFFSEPQGPWEIEDVVLLRFTNNGVEVVATASDGTGVTLFHEAPATSRPQGTALILPATACALSLEEIKVCWARYPRHHLRFRAPRE